jgi:hypothetical protein
MVDDLRNNHLRPGVAMPEVVRLLGKPWSLSSDRRGIGFGVWWIWLTGPSDMQCSTFNVRFVDGRAVESAEGAT